MLSFALMFFFRQSVDDSGVKGAVSLEPSGAPGRAKLLLPFDSEAWFLLLRRLERLAGPPSVLAPMLSFPEVFVVIIVSCTFEIPSLCFSINGLTIFACRSALWISLFCYRTVAAAYDSVLCTVCER
jgi:hypothetical protein